MWRNLVGMKFGHLTVIKQADDYIYPSTGRHEPRYICECDCPEHNKVTAIQHNLLNGRTTNCGCDPAKSKSKLKDMTGKKFGKLTVIKRAEDFIGTNGPEVQWLCKCDCGNEVVVRGHSLRNGHTTSCGCAVVEAATKHGFHGTRIYNIYRGIINRCCNESDSRYENYGARGIYVCDEWSGEDGFIHFKDWAFANGYSEELSIDRIDNDGPYSPDNCRWVDSKTQANNRRSNTILEYNGESHTISEWSEITGMNQYALDARYKSGWSVEDILTVPINNYIKIITNSNGESHTLSEWSEITGISHDTLYDRIFRGNWDVDKALYTPVINAIKFISYNNNTFPLSTWDRILGYSIGTINHRIYRNNYTEEEALLGKKSVMDKFLSKDNSSEQKINAIYFIDENGNPIPQDKWDK